MERSRRTQPRQEPSLRALSCLGSACATVSAPSVVLTSHRATRLARNGARASHVASTCARQCVPRAAPAAAAASVAVLCGGRRHVEAHLLQEGRLLRLEGELELLVGGGLAFLGVAARRLGATLRLGGGKCLGALLVPRL